MIINLARVASSPALGQPFTIVRTAGNWQRGIFVLAEPIEIDTFGPVTSATEKEMVQVPEGDRVAGMQVFRSTAAIHVSERTQDTDYIADQIRWNGELYKVLKILPMQAAGYYRALGARIAGD